MNRLELLTGWKKEVDTYSLKLVEAVPEAFSDYRPVDTVFTFAEQVFHIADDENGADNDLIRALNLPMEIRELKLHPNVKENARVLKEVCAFTDKIFQNLADSDLDKKVNIPGVQIEVTVIRILKSMIEHQIHHRGQLLVYFRNAGLEAPLRWEE